MKGAAYEGSFGADTDFHRVAAVHDVIDRVGEPYKCRNRQTLHQETGRRRHRRRMG